VCVHQHQPEVINNFNINNTFTHIVSIYKRKKYCVGKIIILQHKNLKAENYTMYKFKIIQG